jgi:hypothetical protein
MSWLFSQALVEASLVENSSDGEPCAQLNVMPTRHKFWRNDKTMEPSSLSRFGLTCAVLTEDRGQELLTSYLAGFRARTSAQQAGAQDSRASAAAYGEKCAGSSMKFDPSTSTWKTAQFSLLGDSGSFSGTWPRWGLMRDGDAFPLPIPARRNFESASGLWPTPLSLAAKLWPTPTTMKATGGPALCKWGGAGARKKMASMVTPAEMNGPLNPPWVEWLMGWPIGWSDLTPLETDKFREWQQQHGNFLEVFE